MSFFTPEAFSGSLLGNFLMMFWAKRSLSHDFLCQCINQTPGNVWIRIDVKLLLMQRNNFDYPDRNDNMARIAAGTEGCNWNYLSVSFFLECNSLKP